MQNLQNERTKVRGRNIIVSDAVISEVSILPAEGTRWTDKHVLLQDAIAVFQDEDEQLVHKGKWIHPTYLRKPWQELAIIIQRYITCDGNQDILKPQLKLLAILKQKIALNFSLYLNYLLHDVASRVKKATHIFSSAIIG